MELLLLLALGAGGWMLWKRSRGEDPTATAAGKAVAGCLGLGCLGALLLFVVGVVLLWLLLGALADLDLSLSGFGEDAGQAPGRRS
jgi:hypothetical protein